MKAVSVIGYHHTGKTTTVVALIKALKARGFSVSSIKDIHSEAYRADQAETNSDKHRQAGSDAVYARGLYDGALIFPKPLDLNQITPHFSSQFLIIEGMKQAPVPKIVCAKSLDQLEELVDDSTIAISGMIASTIREYKGIPVFCLQDRLVELVNLVIEKSFAPLPDVDSECCGECGTDCYSMAGDIVQGRRLREDCVLDSRQELTLCVNGTPVQIVPFVQRLLRDTIRSFVKNLKDVDADSEIEIKIR
jgi:molybdopterin-guanine dinucleotide biosynthesis protein B